MCTSLHVKYRLFLSDFNPLNAELNPICHLLALLGAHHILHISRIRVNNPEFSRQIFENSKTPNFINIRPFGAELLQSDGQRDIAQLTVSFRNFENPPKNGSKRNKLSEWEGDWTGSGTCLIAGCNTSVAETPSSAPFSSILQRATLHYNSNHSRQHCTSHPRHSVTSRLHGLDTEVFDMTEMRFVETVSM